MTARRAVLYARVSTRDAARDGAQDPRVQLAACRKWCRVRGWSVVGEFSDRVSGDPDRRRREPPGLAGALGVVERRGADVLVVFGADRLVRSPSHLLALVARVQAGGGHVASLSDGADLDTTSDMGELLLFVRGWFARMELRLGRARTVAGLERARQLGHVLGRPRIAFDERGARELRAAGYSWREIGALLGQSVTTVRRAVS